MPDALSEDTERRKLRNDDKCRENQTRMISRRYYYVKEWDRR